jgi:hypothetical protein
MTAGRFPCIEDEGSEESSPQVVGLAEARENLIACRLLPGQFPLWVAGFVAKFACDLTPHGGRGQSAKGKQQENGGIYPWGLIAIAKRFHD